MAQEQWLTKMPAGKFSFAATALFLGCMALGQAPSELMKKGIEVVYTVNAQIPDPENPQSVNLVSMQITRQTRNGLTVSRSKNLSKPGQNERVILSTKGECLYNVDPLSWTKQGRFVRFSRMQGSMNDEIYEPSYRLNGQDTASLLEAHPPVGGKSSFEKAGDRYDLEVDTQSGLVSKAKIHFATGAIFEKNVAGFKNFEGIYIPTEVICNDNFNPVIEKKEFKLVSTRKIETLDLPFTKESLPPGSRVADHIDFVNYEVDKSGKWIEMSRMPRPVQNQQPPPNQTSKAILFAGFVTSALSLLGTSAFLQSRRRSKR